MWDSSVLGVTKNAVSLNLDPSDGRPCGIVTTDKGITLIVAHFPWINTQEDLIRIQNIITPHIIDPTNIIVIADTNDALTIINKDNPFVVAGKKLSQNKSKAELKDDLITCCWHEEKHIYGTFTDTGDYVLAEHVDRIFRPLQNPSNETEFSELYSDHSPVVAEVTLTAGL